MKKQDEGFTLIELLIVIVILGILAAVVVFAIGGITDSANENACEIDARTVRTAAAAFEAETGAAPVNYGDLTLAGWLESASTNYTVALVATAPCI